MKKILAIILIVILPALSMEQGNCYESEQTGKVDASQQHSHTGWVVGGICSGVLLGLIGTALTTGIAASTNPQPIFIPKDTTINPRCYIHGYKKKAKGRNIVSALLGGLAGTVAFVFIFIAVSDEIN